MGLSSHNDFFADNLCQVLAFWDRLRENDAAMVGQRR